MLQQLSVIMVVVNRQKSLTSDTGSTNRVQVAKLWETLTPAYRCPRRRERSIFKKSCITYITCIMSFVSLHKEQCAPQAAIPVTAEKALFSENRRRRRLQAATLLARLADYKGATRAGPRQVTPRRERYRAVQPRSRIGRSEPHPRERWL